MFVFTGPPPGGGGEPKEGAKSEKFYFSLMLAFGSGQAVLRSCVPMDLLGSLLKRRLERREGEPWASPCERFKREGVARSLPDIPSL